MVAKTKKTARGGDDTVTTPAPDPKKVLTVPDRQDNNWERARAELSLCPVTGSAITAQTFAKGTFGAVDITEAVTAMREATAKVRTGDLSEVESMLMAQALALNSVFTELARRAALNMGEYVIAAETYLRLAFKA